MPERPHIELKHMCRYNTASIKYGMGAVVSTLLGAEAPTREQLECSVHEAALVAIQETREAIKPHWHEALG